MSIAYDMRVPMPAQIDRYLIERELGQGAFGTVYRAKHAVTGRAVALKVLHPRHARDQEMVERFFREARAAASAMSANIVDVLDAGIASDGAPFLALELLDGEDLEAYLARRDRVALLDAVEIGRDLAAGVADAHRMGIVHRDLKPANVFLVRMPDGSRRAKVLDFGMSKLADPLLGSGARTATGAIMGTPLYMAPEQLKGGARDVEPAADVYALGSILFRMLTGRTTHEATTIQELLLRKLSQPVPPASTYVPALPSTLTHLVSRALEVEPTRRNVTSTEMAKELAEIARLLRTQGISPGVSSGGMSGGMSSGGVSLAPSAPPTVGAVSTTSTSSTNWGRIAAWLGLAIVAASCIAATSVLVAMGGLAWLIGDATSSIVEDVREVREATAPLPPATVASPPATSPAPAPAAPDAEGVLVTASVMGMSDGVAERDIAQAARAAMGPCRGEHDETFELEMMWMGWGAMGLGTSSLTPHGPPPTTAAEMCAQGALLDASRGRSSSGIVTFRVRLPAR
ncbi:MAG: serine/threonine protein kinase [Sandaracinaceae bacterium]|nr:serine/threonine protein kinase [Sandaracinaceae bacterium]